MDGSDAGLEQRPQPTVAEFWDTIDCGGAGLPPDPARAGFQHLGPPRGAARQPAWGVAAACAGVASRQLAWGTAAAGPSVTGSPGVTGNARNTKNAEAETAILGNASAQRRVLRPGATGSASSASNPGNAENAENTEAEISSSGGARTER